MNEGIAAPPRSGPVRVPQLPRAYEHTIYGEAADILNDVLCTAINKPDSGSAFAQAIDFSGDFRKLWSATLVCDRFGISQSTLSKWRTPDMAPRAVMRRAALKELRTMLGEAFGRVFDFHDAPELRNVEDLATYARRMVARRLLQRLHEPGAAYDELQFMANLRMSLDLEGYCSASDLSKQLGYSASSLSRWSNEGPAPKILPRQAINEALRDELEAGLHRRQ